MLKVIKQNLYAKILRRDIKEEIILIRLLV